MIIKIFKSLNYHKKNLYFKKLSNNFNIKNPSCYLLKIKSNTHNQKHFKTSIKLTKILISSLNHHLKILNKNKLPYFFHSMPNFLSDYQNNHILDFVNRV